MTGSRRAEATYRAFAESGDIGRQLQQHDWSHTSLGNLESWSPSLTSTLNILLHGVAPMLLVWGSDRLVFYNEAYGQLLERYQLAIALGQPLPDKLQPQEFPDDAPTPDASSRSNSNPSPDPDSDPSSDPDSDPSSDPSPDPSAEPDPIQKALPSDLSAWDQILEDIEQVSSTGQPLWRKEHPWPGLCAINAACISWYYSGIWEDSETVGGVLVVGQEMVLEPDPPEGDSQSWVSQSELQRAEAALLLSEDRYRMLFESIDQGFCVIEVLFDEDDQAVDYRFLEVNPAFEQQSGISNALGKCMSELAPELEDFWFSTYGNVALTGEAQRLEDYAEALDRWYDVYAFRVGPADCRHVALLFTDISDRKLAEKALRESEEQSRNILESISDAFFAIDDEWKFTYMNHAAEVLLERSCDDLIGKTIWQEYPGVEVSEFGPFYRHIAQAQVSGSLTAFYPDHERWYDVRAYPAAKGLTVYFNDITGRKRAELAVIASNERLKLLSGVTSNLLLQQEPKTFLDELFTELSSHLGLEVYFNYLIEEGSTQLQLHASGGVPEAVSQAWRAVGLGEGICGAAVAERRQIVIEAALESEDPQVQPLQRLGIRAYASHPLMVGDRVLGTLDLGTRQRNHFSSDELALMQVIANQVAVALERSRLTRELEARAEALVRTNRIKDEFLAVLSHELRTPLSPILGWSKLLKRGLLNAEKTATAIDTIERNAKLQAQLIEDLLDVSQILQGKMSLAADPVELHQVIEAALSTVQLAAAAKSITLEFHGSTGLGRVMGDAGRLQQVIWNLLSNAVKFTPTGQSITVHLSQVGHCAQIQVTDRGKGIRPEFLPYIFEHFRQEDSTTTRRFGGLGLGLAIARQITEMHGGQVAVSSSGEGQGSTFTVQIPLAEPSPGLTPE